MKASNLSNLKIAMKYIFNLLVTQRVRATQNFKKDKMTGKVDILVVDLVWRIFEKFAKKVKKLP